MNAGDECVLGCMAILADVFPLAASVVCELEVLLSWDTKVVLANWRATSIPSAQSSSIFCTTLLDNKLKGQSRVKASTAAAPGSGCQATYLGS